MANLHRTSSPASAPITGPLRRWMQAVGVFYVAQFVAMAIVRAPIRTFGPTDTLTRADQGDPLASFVVDTWTIFGLEVLAVGVVLLVATRIGELARGAILTVLAVEISRGLIADTYMIIRGIHVTGYLVWIAIHSAVLVTGAFAWRAAHRTETPRDLAAAATAS